MRSQRGVTLLELLIAITLVGGLSAGMLMAMRTALGAYEKTSQRLASNRRAMKIEQILTSQWSSIIPVRLTCAPGGQSAASLSPSFLSGNAQTLHLVTSYSIAEGYRGYPQIVQYRIEALRGGGARLLAGEMPYTGPLSLQPFCTGAPVTMPSEMVIADHLLSAGFVYHEPYLNNSYAERPWVAEWLRAQLPAAIRLDLRAAPDPGGLPRLGVTVPIRVDRSAAGAYVDLF